MMFSVKRSVGALLLATLSSWGLSAQLSFGGSPIEVSTRSNELRIGSLNATHSPFTITPDFSVEDFRARYSWNNQENMGSAYIVGTSLDVNKDFFEIASSFVIGGRRVYLAELSATDAQALSVTFDKMQLASGDKLYIYTPERSHILGAFTSETNPDGGIMGTAPLRGNTVCIQYETSSTSSRRAQIHIDHLGYLCNLSSDNREMALPPNNIGETMSGVCHVNINCPEGDNMRDVQNGITQIYTKLGKGLYAICSGTVVNNTKKDFRPLVITAAHCMINKGVEASADDLREWVFTFHYERPYCHNNEMAKAFTPTLSGAKKLALTSNSKESDGLLLELLQPIPDSYGVYYNGWNREDVAAEKAVGVHHPKGDAMKISTVDKPLESSQFIVTSGDHVTGGVNAHWLAIFAKTANGHGVTEGGSSGSGLFNPQNELIGTLSGGASKCERVTASNHYGKLSKHWNAYSKGDNASNMDIYLDPVNNGTSLKMSGAYKPGTQYIGRVKELKAKLEKGKVTVSWQPLTSLPTSVQGNTIVYRDDKEIARLALTDGEYIDNAPTSLGGIAVYSVAYTYAVGSEAKVTSPSTSLAVFLAEPAPVKATSESLSNGKTRITWQKPVNRQRITQVSLNSEKDARIIQNFTYFGLTLPKTIYMGLRYDGSDFRQIPEARITGARFIPARGATMHNYELYIRNGANYKVDRTDSYVKMEDTDKEVRSYPLQSLGYEEGKWLTVQGFNPFKVSSDEFLIVGLKATTATEWNKKAFVTDATPLSKKSVAKSVFSFDSEKWMPMTEPMTEAEGKAFVMDFYIDDAAIDAPVDLSGNIAYGTMPAPFPKVKSYKIYMENTFLTEVSETADHSYEISNAPSGSTFYVFPVYEDGRVVTANEPIVATTTPEVYPTVIRQDLTISGLGNQAMVRIYNAAGTSIMTANGGDRMSISCESWTSGLYLVEVTTAEGTFLTKVTKL